MGVEFIYPEFEVIRNEHAVSGAESVNSNVPTVSIPLMPDRASSRLTSPNASTVSAAYPSAQPGL